MICDYNIVKYIFIFNILIIVVFSLIYSSILPNNFEPLKTKDKLTYIDYLFYATTIQTSVGLPDITAVSPLAKILALIQQFILMGSTYVLLTLFLKNK